ncbi:MAG: glutathione S-transferase family protein [Qingshengfaniella sp.]
MTDPSPSHTLPVSGDNGPVTNTAVLDFYAAGTANNVKVAILLNLLGLAYRVIPVPLKHGTSRPEGLAAASLTGKVPAIVDHRTGQALCESAAILIYLAETYGSPLWPAPGKDRAHALQWLMAVSSTFTPAMTEARFYLHLNPRAAPLAETRVTAQVHHAYRTADTALARTPCLTGDGLSLADLALWPYVARFACQGIDLADYPHVKDWYLRLAGIPAFRKGWDVLDQGAALPLPA